jgi:hypothetical protein
VNLGRPASGAEEEVKKMELNLARRLIISLPACARASAFVFLCVLAAAQSPPDNALSVFLLRAASCNAEKKSHFGSIIVHEAIKRLALHKSRVQCALICSRVANSGLD